MMVASSSAQTQQTGIEFGVHNTFLEFRKMPTGRFRRYGTAPALHESSDDEASDLEGCERRPGNISDVDTHVEGSSHHTDSDDNMNSGSGSRVRPQAPLRARPQAPQPKPVRTMPAQALAAASKPGRARELPQAQMLAEERRTTVMLRNLPLNYTREMFFEMLDAEGFSGKYDFVYLPIDYKTRCGVGYAFVNLVEPAVVQPFWETFDGYKSWVLPTTKICQVCWSVPHQGLRVYLQRYRNSSVMHESVPEEFKPCIFVDGVRAKFPSPTRPLQEPQWQC